ncbi:hypothetical protein [Bacteroides reticulotermitis]
MNRLKECLDGDTLLDNYDLAQLSGVTQRTIRQKKNLKLWVTPNRNKLKA